MLVPQSRDTHREVGKGALSLGLWLLTAYEPLVHGRQFTMLRVQRFTGKV